jgi:hypothetical protein
MLDVPRRVDSGVLAVLHRQLGDTRRLDRQLGAVVAQAEVLTKVNQVSELLTYSVGTEVRRLLAGLLAELLALAGWQALDRGHPRQAWAFY